MSDFSIGSIVAGVTLDLSGLEAGVRGARALLGALGDSMRESLSGIGLEDQGRALPDTLARGIAEGQPRVTDALRHLIDSQRRQLDTMRRSASETADQIREALEAAYSATHSDTENRRDEALKTYRSRIGVDPDNAELRKAAATELAATMNKIDADVVADNEEASQKVIAAWTREVEAHEAQKERERRATMRQLQQEQEAYRRYFAWIAGLFRQDEAERVEQDERRQAAEKRLLASLREENARYRQERRHMADNAMEYALDHNEITLAQYRDYLARKLAATKQYSDEWMQLQKQIEQIDRQIPAQAPGTELQKFGDLWKSVAQSMRSTLEGALVDIFDHGFKGFFQSILDGFKKLLEQMLAQAITSGILSLLTGGSFGGGFLGALGFDDGANDLSAKRWGWDFASMFSRGAGDYQHSRGVDQGGSLVKSGTGHAITINMSGDQHYHNDLDVRRVADEVSWHVQQRLKVVR